MPPKQAWKERPRPPPTAFDLQRTLTDTVETLRTYVVATLQGTNLLCMPDSEIRAMAELLLAASTKGEVFEWASTLMQPESFAAEVIERREGLGMRFADSAPTVAPAAQPKQQHSLNLAHQHKKTERNKKNKSNAVSKTDEGQLVSGVLFECGCFATTHAFKSNCANCGRIFCQQEDDTECYNCGMDTKRCVNYEIAIESGSVDKAQSRAEYEAAVAKRDRLLKYAKERAKRTTVIDDQGAFGAESTKNVWATKEERAQASAELQAEQARVAEMHRKTGAYSVHLDIASQSACYIPPPTAVEHARPTSTPGASEPPAAESSESDSSASDADTRAMPMPALLQKIWYAENTDSEAVDRMLKQKDTNNNNNNNSVKKNADIRAVVKATRVQTDYYEDDFGAHLLAEDNMEDEKRKEQERNEILSKVEYNAGAARVFADEEQQQGSSGGVFAPLVAEFAAGAPSSVEMHLSGWKLTSAVCHVSESAGETLGNAYPCTSRGHPCSLRASRLMRAVAGRRSTAGGYGFTQQLQNPPLR